MGSAASQATATSTSLLCRSDRRTELKEPTDCNQPIRYRLQVNLEPISPLINSGFQMGHHKSSGKAPSSLHSDCKGF